MFIRNNQIIKRPAKNHSNLQPVDESDTFTELLNDQSKEVPPSEEEINKILVEAGVDPHAKPEKKLNAQKRWQQDHKIDPRIIPQLIPGDKEAKMRKWYQNHKPSSKQNIEKDNAEEQRRAIKRTKS